MAFPAEHALHKRRFGRNLGVALILAAFAVVLFGLTLAKISSGSMMEGYDHTPRASMLPRDSAQ